MSGDFEKFVLLLFPNALRKIYHNKGLFVLSFHLLKKFRQSLTKLLFQDATMQFNDLFLLWQPMFPSIKMCDNHILNPNVDWNQLGRNLFNFPNRLRFLSKDCLKENLFLKSLFYRLSLSFMKKFYFSQVHTLTWDPLKLNIAEYFSYQPWTQIILSAPHTNKKETILSLKKVFQSIITNNTTISLSLQKEKAPEIEKE